MLIVCCCESAVFVYVSVDSLTFAIRVLLVRISRGNQREKDREKAQARNGKKGSSAKDDGLTPEQRRERDAKALQEKAAKKAAQAAGDTGGTSKK